MIGILNDDGETTMEFSYANILCVFSLFMRVYQIYAGL